jgi:hypothetical protein
MSKNEHTGDLQQTKGILSESARAEFDRLFPPKKIVRGRFKEDKETGEFIPIHEWNRKYAEAPRPKGPLLVVKGFDAFQSPTTGKVIRNDRELEYDMKASGCRTYEGREQEQKEVDKYLKAQDDELEACVDDTLAETMYQIEHNYSRPEAPSRVVFELGDVDE